MSVLNLSDGNVLYRTPAHSGQRVTSVQILPDTGYVLSTGINHCECFAFQSLFVISSFMCILKVKI